MHLDMRGRNLNLTPAMIERIDRRMRFALSRFADRIGRVSVRIADLNGLRGGADKQCRIVVTIRAAEPVRVEDMDADLEAAVDRAADRVQRCVARAIERERSTRLSPDGTENES